MAGNFGKFIDRSPIICAAGKPTGDPCGATVASTLKEYSLEDKITTLKHDAKIWNEDIFVPPLKALPIRHPDFNGIQTESKPLLNPPVQTRYQTLLKDLRETAYLSYWTKEVGKVKDQVSGLPAGMSPTEVKFGKPSVKEISLKELLNPSKPPDQVMQESEVGHELYKRTHNDYCTFEKVERGYNPPFDPSKKFGIKSKYDPRGIGAKCCVDWFTNEPTVKGNSLQADYFGRVKPQIGRTLAPNHNIACVPVGHTFGDPTKRACHGVEDLLKDPNVEPCFFKRDLYRWMSSLNKLRILMRKRASQCLNMNSFHSRALYFDKEKTGFLSIKEFYDLCSCFQINFAKDDIEALLKLLNIIEDDKINYKRFINLIDTNAASVDLKQIQAIPEKNLYYTTTSQAGECDYLLIDNTNMPVAGIPSVRTDLPRPIVPPKGCRADLDHLGDDTSAKALINPSIFTAYGLNYRDFYMPRLPEMLRSLFEKIGYSFPGDTFDRIWKEGVEIDKTGLVCVDTFNTLAKKHFPSKKLAVDELECTKILL